MSLKAVNKLEPSPIQTGLPPLYKSVAVVRAQDHGRVGLSPLADYGFAASASAIPLTVAEFALAGLHYPIVFSAGASPAPVAVMGLRSQSNLFVNRWNASAAAGGTPRYIPAYVRRYPFIIIEAEPGAPQLLGLDMACARVAEVGEREVGALFGADGTHSATAQSAIEFCRDYHRLHLLTVEFMEALVAHKLLAAHSTAIHFADRSRHSVEGFQVIDEAALRALPADVVADWHVRGWLSLATLHLASQQNWSALVDLQEAADRARAA